MIDANEQIDTNASSIAKLAIECSLIDIIATRHQQAHNTATYTRGTKRIDYILVNETLARAVTDCGILAFFDGIHSDHRGSFIDLDTRCIFSDRTPILYSQPMRQLCSKKPKSVKAYKEELWKQMSAHNIQNKSASISNNATQDDTFNQKFAKELNNIANTMQQAMIRAESMCTKSPAAPYSEKMANLNKIIRYWKTKKSAMKTKRDALINCNRSDNHFHLPTKQNS